MRTIRLIPLVLFFPLLLLAGCNPDVFMEKLEASCTEFSFPMTGGQAEVELTHGDWMLERIAVDRVDAEGWVTHEDGKEEYCSLYLKGKGKARYESEFHGFEIVRDSGDRLLMTFGQSMDPDSRLIELYLVNDYEEVFIKVIMDGCSGYVFDRIEYSDVTYHTTGQYDEAWALDISNDSDDVVMQKFDIFNKDAARKIDLPAGSVTSDVIPRPHWYAELIRYLDGNSFEIPAPSPFLHDGKLTFNGFSVPFRYGEQSFDTDFPDEKVQIEVQPGTSRLRVFWEYEEYGVDYTVWLKHEGGGRPLSFSGVMHSKTYTGGWVHLYGPDLGE